MVTYCLNDERAKESDDLRMLLAEMQQAKKESVFRTFVPGLGDRNFFVLSTTNEKLHLAFGKLSNKARNTLCCLFLQRLQGVAELVFTFQPAEGDVQPRSLFVTMSHLQSGDLHFHVAPGH